MPAEPGVRLRIWWHGLFLIALGAAVYANSLHSPFVFDDHGSIVDNPFLRQLWPLSSAASGPVQSAVAGRPVISVSLALNYAAANGLDPAAFRAWNLGVHLLAALTLFGLVRRTLTAPVRPLGSAESATWVAWVAAAVWLLHPLNSEVVDYVTQRTESTMGLFYLLTAYAAARAMAAAGRPWGWWTLAVIACGLGMASKESMVTAPIMVLIYDLVFWSGGLRRALRARWPMYTGLAATWIILIALVASGPRSHSAGFSAGIGVWTYLSNQPAMVLQYLKLALWPGELVLDYGIPRPLTIGQVLPSALVIGSLLVGTLAAWRRWPGPAFLATWFFVTLAPSSSLLPIATEVGAERRMYLPLAAITVGVAVLLQRLLTERLATRSMLARATVMVGVVTVLCSVLSALTVRRNREYQSATGIWQTVLDRHPHGRAHYNLAIELREQGHRNEALQHYRLALSDEPAAHYAVGFELAADGRFGEAIPHYRDFIRLRPDDLKVVDAYVLLGRALKSERQFGAAVDALREAMRRHPSNLDARIELAEALFKLQRFDDALETYRDLARRAPANPIAHSGLGIALVALGRDHEAIDAFTVAAKLQPGDPSVRYNLANALASNGRLDESIAEYRRALALSPASVTFHNALGLVLAASGRPDEALTEFRRSRSIDPADRESREYVEAVFAELRSTNAVHDPSFR